MNYPAFTNESLTMMYEAVRGALAADDVLRKQGEEAKWAFQIYSEFLRANEAHRSGANKRQGFDHPPPRA